MPFPPLRLLPELAGKTIASAQREDTEFDTTDILRLHFTDGTELRIEAEGGEITFDVYGS